MGAIASAMTDEEVLQFTQGMRRQLVIDMTPEGKMPSDPKDRAIFLQTLADMDRQALTNKRISGDTKRSEDDRKAAALIATIFATIGNKSPFQSDIAGERVIDVPAVLVEDVELVPGETEIGITRLTYDDFVAKR
jgi:hypothetical protein